MKNCKALPVPETKRHGSITIRNKTVISVGNGFKVLPPNSTVADLKLAPLRTAREVAAMLCNPTKLNTNLSFLI